MRRYRLNGNRTTSTKLEHVENVTSLGKAYEVPSSLKNSRKATLYPTWLLHDMKTVLPTS